MSRPSGPTIALVPTVEMLTTLRPVSSARIRAIASCCTLSSVRPKSALFDWARMRPAPSWTMSVVSWSSTMSKQIAMPAVTPATSIT